MALLVAGPTDAQIAVRLFLSVNAVRSHLDRTRDKPVRRAARALGRIQLIARD